MKTLCLAAAVAASMVLVASAANASDCEPVAAHRVAPSFLPDGMTNRDHMAMISYRISANGRAVDIRVTDENADPRFVRASTEALRHWRWDVRTCAPEAGKTYSARFTYLPTSEDDLTVAFNPQPKLGNIAVASNHLSAGALSDANAMRQEVLKHGKVYDLRDGMPYADLKSGR